MRRLFSALLLLSPLVACAASPSLVKPGRHASPSAGCEIEITISGMGGFRELALIQGKSVIPIARDVSGAQWRDSKTLIYTVSPIYGKPGLFQLNCKTGKSHRVVAPSTIDNAYPDGADYFELTSIDAAKSEACYFYAPHVDHADFEHIREAKSRRCVSVK
jgi:hypothetical protein